MVVEPLLVDFLDEPDEPVELELFDELLEPFEVDPPDEEVFDPLPADVVARLLALLGAPADEVLLVEVW